METHLMNKLVQSIINQTYQNWELIIIDQSKNFASKKYEELDSRIRAIPSDKKGLSLNRNIGLDKATGRIIGFPDDDCYYDICLLDEIVKICENNNRTSVIIANRILYTDNKEKLIKSCQEDILRNIDIFKKAVSYNIFFNSLNQKNINLLRFDTNFGIGAFYGACEESILLFSLLCKEWGIIRLKSGHVYHPDKRYTLDKNPQRILNYSRGFGAFASVMTRDEIYSIAMLLMGGAVKNLVLGYIFRIKLNKIKFLGFMEGYLKYCDAR